MHSLLNALLVVVLVAAIPVGQADQEPDPEGEWTLKNAYDRQYEIELSHMIFPVQRRCTANKYRNDSEDEGTNKTRARLWSVLMSDYLFFSEKMLTENATEFLEEAFETRPDYKMIYYGIVILILLGLAFTIVFSIILSCLGFVCVRFILVICILISRMGIKKVVRRFVIRRETMRRRKEDYLIKKSHVKIKPPRRNFRLARWLRNYSDEEVPDELRETTEEQLAYQKDVSSSDSDKYAKSDARSTASHKGKGKGLHKVLDSLARNSLEKKKKGEISSGVAQKMKTLTKKAKIEGGGDK